MPRKKRLSKPIPSMPGWADYRSGKRTAIYTDAFVEALARDFRIGPERVPELKRLLEDWADVYRRHKYEYDDRRHITAGIKAELEEVKRRVEALKAALENVHPETAWRFWAPESGPGVEFPSFTRKKIFVGPHGHTITKIRTGRKRYVIVRIEETDHFEVLTILRNYAETAIARLPHDKGGQFSSQALRMWLINVRAYFETDLSRPFTHKKEGAAFCVKAFKPIDSSIAESRLQREIQNLLYPPKIKRVGQ